MALAFQAFSQVSPVVRSVSRPKKSRRLLGGFLIAGAAIAVSGWMLATVSTMQTMATSLSDTRSSGMQASLDLRPIVRPAPKERSIRVSKFSRLGILTSDQLPAGNLTAENVRSSRQRMAARALKASSVTAARQALAMALAKAAPPSTQVAATNTAPSTMLTALAESAPVQNASLDQRFNLILNDPQPSLTDSLADTLPDAGPLPGSRPKPLPKAAVQVPVERELAYARPDKPVIETAPRNNTFSTPGSRSRVAIYDIEAGMVYLPGGERLEAHSGIGVMRDNPKFVHTRMRGATPPHTYVLTRREALFHGVEALRLTPIDGIKPHGRDGLLAHTYMLGPSGNSNGCVVFRDYRRFLAAFKRGEINRMVVIPRMPSSQSQIASLWSSGA